MRNECGSHRRKEAKMARYLALGIVMVLMTCLGMAQTQTGTYRIQIEDELGIAVFDEPQIVGRVVVTTDGNIVAPFGGVVKAVGKTTSELEAELADIYVTKLKLRDPKVSVTILRVRRILASIGGSVEKGGQYEVRDGMTVRDLLTFGGVRDLIGDTKHATFKRKGWTESIPIDLYSMMTYSNNAQNYVIQDGDSIMVPPIKGQFVRIYGEVQRPTNIQFDDDMNLVSAINIAGGFIPNRSKKSRILVVRAKPGNPDTYYMIECDLAAYESKKDFAQNIKLHPGDTIIVPNNGNPNFDLIGSVANFFFILDRFGVNIFGNP